MHAYIVTGGSSNERNERITTLLNERRVSPHDTITIIPEGASIRIDSVRGVAIRLSIRPIAGPCHAVVVYNAHAMTQEAQNAFLKTLEEPPGEAIIILETDQPDALLPTILSRVVTIRLKETAHHPSDALFQCFKTLEQLTNASVGERLHTIDTFAKTNEDALAFVNLAIAALEQELKLHGRSAKLLRSLLTSRTQLLGNVNAKLAMDEAFLYNGF